MSLALTDLQVTLWTLRGIVQGSQFTCQDREITLSLSMRLQFSRRRKCASSLAVLFLSFTVLLADSEVCIIVLRQFHLDVNVYATINASNSSFALGHVKLYSYIAISVLFVTKSP